MQAVLILAHKNVDQVISLSNLLKKRFLVLVHFDTRLSLTDQDKEKLQKNDIDYISEVEVHWGSWSIAQAAISLMKKALENSKVKYLHVISGQDWPVADLSKVYNFYENNDKIYMEYNRSKDVKKSGESVILWQKYYFNYDRINRRSGFGKFYHRFLLAAQTILRINKFKKYNIELEIYNGPNWVDMPRDAVEYCLGYLEAHPELLKVFQTGCFSDEFWMQTILVNSPKYKERIVKDNHRYINWKKQNGSYPAVLDERNFESITKSGCHFGRKFDWKYSEKLIDRLNEKYAE
ncbi:beta-1,6-N-acetylglucosaminyltransferase [Liquorilactobacillus oeni]|uniref:Peptide O-xylosyltransferase n=1 Tax=Liquorilactobacillus oeni DSM 19972 TaxID=1423777 RepID=A0A0R1MCR2_9LACO|nr:beta-1,6-N-acetylglucosaminyltransferase [Liquorilactobacillus oeni]KRL05798.1 glycosyltransferase [Liquorilactobacillus oeni DSM 19972]